MQEENEKSYASAFDKYNEFVRHIFAGNYSGFRTILQERPEVIDCMEVYAISLYYTDIQSNLGETAVQEFDTVVRQRIRQLEAELNKELNRAAVQTPSV